MEHDPKIKMIVSAILFVMCLMILFYFLFFDPQFPVILCFSLLIFITGIDLYISYKKKKSVITMATTKLSATKSTSRAINYAEKRAVEKSGLNCDVDYAKSSFKASRELYGKTDGNQGHVIIQSFKPGEVTPEQCNQLGLALAEKLAPNHQVAVYTHADTDHVHNHIVINSIDLETGKKFNNNKKALRNVRDFNDEVCIEHGLSVPNKDTARLRYTQTEKAIADPNTKSTAQYSWKDEIREAIDQSQATNMDEFKDHLKQHGITIERVTPKSITYRHLAEDKKVRGRKLGEDYNKGGIEDGFERQIQHQQQTERAIGRRNKLVFV